MSTHMSNIWRNLELHESSKRGGRNSSCILTPSCKNLISFAAADYVRQTHSPNDVAAAESAEVSIHLVVSTSICRWQWQIN